MNIDRLTKELLYKDFILSNTLTSYINSELERILYL